MTQTEDNGNVRNHYYHDHLIITITNLKIIDKHHQHQQQQ